MRLTNMYFKYKWQVNLISKISWVIKRLTNRNVKSITTTILVLYPNKKWSYI